MVSRQADLVLQLSGEVKFCDQKSQGHKPDKSNVLQGQQNFTLLSRNFSEKKKKPTSESIILFSSTSGATPSKYDYSMI